jgi:N-acetylneuraminic acid mutarotase
MFARKSIDRIAVLVLGLFAAVTSAQTAPNEWTWMGGSKTLGAGSSVPGVYGTLGTPAAANIPGGRYLPSTWTDSNGNFWLFGGEGSDENNTIGLLNDLWEFNPSSNEWTWVGGSNAVPNCSPIPQILCGQPGVYGTLGTPASGNFPGARYGAATWTDKSGNLWLFGGVAFDSAGNRDDLNDLWEFNPSTKEWTWIGGVNTFVTGVGVPGVYGTKGTPAAGNIPGGRSSASAWVDNNGNFWLFGGGGYDSANTDGFLNDLWEFNPSSNQWTWVTGSKTESTFSSQYGQLGTPAAGNTPGGRWQATSWHDNAGNLWLFGGEGFDSGQNFGAENDFWEFEISTSEWTWMGGSALGDEPGIYGTLGVASSKNIPGSRTGALQWTDNQGHFWLLGGEGNDGNDVSALLNDLWEFNPSTNEWTWVAGTKDVPSNFIVPGVYGTPGVAAPGNVPGGRYESASWVDKTGNLWLLGGLAYDSAGNFGNLNDVWEFEIASGSITPSVTVSPASPSIVANQPLNVTVSVSGGGSNPAPTGSVTLSSGSYSSAATTLNGGSATITIPANSLVVGTATLTATYAPDAASAATYSDATGSGTVMITGNPVPAILNNGNGVEPVVIQAGVGGITLTVTGTGFVPASVVDFNGSPRATTYVSATELTAQILASDVATIGSWPITVVNPPPGGGTSNAVTFNASLFAQTLTPGSLTFTSAVGATTATQTATFANVGNIPYFPVVIGLSEAPPNAFSIVANTCPNDLLGGASCTISIAFTPPTAGTFTAALVFDNGAYENNNSTILTGYGLNAAVAVTPSPSSISATESLAVTVFVAGSAGNPTPTGSVTLTSGSYASAPTTLSGGSAVIIIPAGSLSNGTDSLTAKYSPDSASTSIYPSATGSNTVAVSAQAQSPLQWAWISGSNTVGGSGGRPGVYGTLQTPAAANVPGGRNNAVGWTNASGNLWLFGGAGLDANGSSGDLNDLWEFNPSTNQWTWISGSSAFVLGYINGVTQNVPFDSVFGTMGVAAAGNTPGGRAGAVAWTDKSGNLWLFGGAGAESEPFAGYEYTESPGQFNDLWEFNPSTNQWAWMGGSNLVNQSGVYGTLGTPAAGNIPGGRANAVSWTDNNGNFWLFGGYGWDSAGTPGYLNDLWEYSSSTKQWAWIAGSNTIPLNTSDPAHDGAFGVYGTQGTAASGNTPGARIGAIAQTDPDGNLWMFGGSGLDSDGTYGYLDDLWEFSPSTGLWRWVGGTKKVPGATNSGQPGIYGTFGVPAALNDAGGRTGAVSWSDKSGNLWLMGGQGYDGNDNLGGLNDVWAYQLSGDEGTWLGGNSALSCVSQICAGEPGEYGVLRTAAIGNTPGGRSGAVSWTDSSGRFWLFGGTGQDANNDSGLLNDLWSVEPAALAAPSTITPSVTVTPSPASITSTQALSVTITVSGGSGNPTPTGSITLTSGSFSSEAVTLSGGSASINLPAGSLASGSDTLTASYTPDSNSSSTYNSATGTSTESVTAAATAPSVTVVPSPASITTAQALSVTVTVGGTPTPTGSVTLTSGTYSSGAVTLSADAATISIPAGTLAKGTDTLTASYTPDANSSSTYTNSTGSNSVTVTSPALITPSVSVTPSPASITTTQALTVTVAVSGGNGNPIPTGSVILTSGSYSSGAVTLTGGTATINIAAGSLAVGADALTADYTPDSNSSSTYNSATGSNTVTVTAAIAQVTVGTSPAGLSFSVDGTSYSATQSLTWTVGSSHTIATTSPQNMAGTQDTFAVWSDAGAISHSVTAPATATTYTASFTATAYQLTTAASPAADGTVTPASGTFYAPGTVVNLTATANTGFSFTNWTGNVASANSDATTITMSAPQSVTANFGAVVAAPVASLSALSPPTFTATVGTTSAAQSATLTNSGNAALDISGITITGTNPTDFAISTGSNACGTALAAGANCLIYVTFTPASVATISATLSVTDNAASSPQTVSLSGTGTPPPTFTLSSPTAPQTVQAGGAAQYTITAAAQNGTFSSAVTLAAIGLSTGAVATFSPASVTPGSSSANSTLSIQTASTTATAATRSATWPFATSALAVIGLCLVPGKRRRRWITMAVLLIASLGAFTALTACGGGFALVSPSQSYTITVTGTSGTDVQTTAVQLTVQ